MDRIGCTWMGFHQRTLNLIWFVRRLSLWKFVYVVHGCRDRLMYIFCYYCLWAALGLKSNFAEVKRIYQSLCIIQGWIYLSPCILHEVKDTKKSKICFWTFVISCANKIINKSYVPTSEWRLQEHYSTYLIHKLCDYQLTQITNFQLHIILFVQDLLWWATSGLPADRIASTECMQAI